MFINQICIGLLSQCNWCCEYCIAYNNDTNIDEEKIFDDLYPKRDKLKKLWISGGEPGLLSESFWCKLLKSIDFNLKICTNGTFISNGLYDKFEKRINEVMIHCVRELDDEINPKVLNTYKQNRSKMNINIVVHRYNINKVKSFLKKYNDIDFTIHFADRSFENFGLGNYEYSIDKESAMKLIKELKNSRYTDKIVKSIIKNDFKELNDWSNKNKFLEG